MIGAHKRFNKKLFEQNDPKARRLAKRFFKEDRGIELVDNPDRYGPDLMIYEDGEHTGFVECEVKLVWKTDAFPYDSVQFPERKKKYVVNTDKPVWFFMLNGKFNKALITTGESVINSKLVPVRNRFVYQDEMFFQVPLDQVEFVDIGEKEDEE